MMLKWRTEQAIGIRYIDMQGKSISGRRDSESKDPKVTESWPVHETARRWHGHTGVKERRRSGKCIREVMGPYKACEDISFLWVWSTILGHFAGEWYDSIDLLKGLLGCFVVGEPGRTGKILLRILQ